MAPAARARRLPVVAALLIACTFGLEVAAARVATSVTRDPSMGTPAAVIPPHPRLILTRSRAAAIAALPNSSDAWARDFCARCVAQAFHWVGADARHFAGDPNGRQLIQRLYSLLLGAVVAPSPTAAAAFRAAAARALLAAAAAPEFDPNGTAALNTGEVLHGLGLGFDWLFEDLTVAQRAAVVAAIAGPGLSRVREALSPTPPPWAKAFVSTNSNWNTVVLGGTIVACLAVQGEPGSPPWVDELLNAALRNLSSWSASAWGPDGAWPEGLNYGGYAQRYLVPAVAALVSATGGDGGLLALPGVLQGPRAIAAGLAPTRPFPTLWDYFDARVVPETLGSWLATAGWAADGPSAAAVKAALSAVAPSIPVNDTETTAMNAPLALLYYTPLGAPGEEAALPLVARFRGVEVAAARSAWRDANATFIGFKGLNTTGNWAHTHLDQGSFVFATEGQWFAQDLGSDNYGAPGYFSGARFNLLRTNISGHNALSFGGENPRCRVLDTYAADCAPALFTTFNVTAGDAAVNAYAVVNLTDGFAHLSASLRRVERGFIVGAGRRQLVVVDEVVVGGGSGAPLAPLWWQLYTVANVSLSPDARAAALSTSNVTAVVTVRFLAAASDCAGAVFAVHNVSLPPPLLEAPGVRVLRLTADAAACSRVVVEVGVNPQGVGAGVRPLAEWAALGPLL
jgi:hypothetical protein